MVIDINPVLANEAAPILVTELGIIIDVNPEHT
jgi:hypothetical protein